MRELINFNELRERYAHRMTDKYISRDIQNHWNSKKNDPEYLDFCYNNPEYEVRAVKAGIHAEIIGTKGSFFICPDDYICLCAPFFDIKNAEIVVKPQESFEKNYVKFN